MSNFESILQRLTEMSPFVGAEDKMEQKKLSIISVLQLNRAWKLLKKFEDGFSIYQIKNGLGFIGGKLIGDKFSIYVDLNVEQPYKNAPTFLKNSVQVEKVDTSLGSEERGYAKKVYHSVAKKFTLISDTEQYIASKKLWQSLARENDIFVYIWDDSNGNFILDNNKPKRYNGSNIDEINIFRAEDKHYKITLIASPKEITK